MKLPNAEQAVVAREKIVDYLLNGAHPDNGGKAGFFLDLGFSGENWRIFAEALQELARTAAVTKSLESSHGRKYIIEGRIDCPSGKTPLVRAIWIVDRDLATPRLVTAYPHEADR